MKFSSRSREPTAVYTMLAPGEVKKTLLAIQKPNMYTKNMQRVQPALALEDMIRFAKLMLRFQTIERAIHLPMPGRETPENDVEHSYQLAMMAWYLNSSGQLGYDIDKIIRYALVHDLPETYAGDVHAYDAHGRQGKAERERQALNRIMREHPEAAEIVDTVHQYDRLEDPESRFVYALDKILPCMYVFLEGGTSWREYGLTAEAIHANKIEKVALSKPIKELYEQLAKLINQNPQLFEVKPSQSTAS